MGTCAADGVWVVVVVEVVDVEVVERRLTFRFGPESNQLENHSVGRKVIYWLGLFFFRFSLRCRKREGKREPTPLAN